MVMQNRHDGANSHEWWEDLPPGLRKRFGNTPLPDPQPSPGEPAGQRPTSDAPPATRPGVLRDLSRVAGLFVVVAVINLLFLLIALAFLFNFNGQPAH
jgi:hypothetical protein